MNKDLSELLTDTEWGITKDITEVMFNKIKAETQEELNIKAALLKQSFLNQFELCFEIEFLKASENL